MQFTKKRTLKMCGLGGFLELLQVQSGVGSMGKELDLCTLNARLGNPVIDGFTCNFKNYSSLYGTFVANVVAFRLKKNHAQAMYCHVACCSALLALGALQLLQANVICKELNLCTRQ